MQRLSNEPARNTFDPNHSFDLSKSSNIDTKTNLELFPNRSLDYRNQSRVTHRYDERKVVTRFAELTALSASNDALQELSTDTWWQTERAVTLYGNLENDVSEKLLPSRKELAGSEQYEVGSDDVREYESWATFRQEHKCITSIPQSHFDCAIMQFQQTVHNILRQLDEDVSQLSVKMQRRIGASEGEFEQIIDAAYPSCTEVHPYLAKTTIATNNL